MTLSYSLALVNLIPSWLVWAEIECTVHVALQKQPISTSLEQFSQPGQPKRKQKLRIGNGNSGSILGIYSGSSTPNY
jgi:hypothetical protein